MTKKLVFAIYYDETGITRNKESVPIEMIPEVCMMIAKEKEILTNKWNDYKRM